MASVSGVKNPKLTSSSVRYSCSVSNGHEKLTITGPKNLQKALGKKLHLAVIRATQAPPAGGKLTFTFGWKH